MSAPRARRSFTVMLAALLTVPLGLAFGPALPAAAYPVPTVDLVGHGWGHGNGMGQYGALGYALDEGWGYTRILDHYYGGTTLGTTADAEIGVRLTEHDGRDLLLTSASPFAIGSNAFEPGTAARVRRANGLWAIDRGPSCAGPWTPAQGDIDASQAPEAATTYGGDDVNAMIRVCGADVRSYRGRIRAVVADGTQRAVNVVDMEQYLRGVVPRESPASWGSLGGGRGMEQLKAQAVAARSYAWAESRSSYARTCDTTACQVYGGAGLNGARIESANTDFAIAATVGQVRLSPDRSVACTEFSSSTGGWTSGRSFPPVADDGDGIAANPNHTWRASLDVGRIERAYPSVGTLTALRVLRRNGLGEDGGRVLDLQVAGSRGSVTTTGNAFRSTLGLRSDWFRIEPPRVPEPVVGMAATAPGDGYWLATGAGGVVSGGLAASAGSLVGRPLNQRVVGMAVTPSGGGYWLVARDGGVFTFGDARFYGSTGGRPLNQHIVGMAASPSGLGYWLVAADGGIFTFGDARFSGSMGGRPLNQPIVGMAARDASSYWLVARDGGIFSFGGAPFRGSAGNLALVSPIAGMARHPSGDGYWMVAGDGGVFSYGASRFFGSGAGSGAQVVAMATTATGGGYFIADRSGNVIVFGDARLS